MSNLRAYFSVLSPIIDRSDASVEQRAGRPALRIRRGLSLLLVALPLTATVIAKTKKSTKPVRFSGMCFKVALILTACVVQSFLLPEISRAQSLGSVNIGTTGTAVSVPVTISSAGTLGSIEVLTGGVTGLDFTSASGGSCATGTSYGAGNTCTVNVTFTPEYAGSRYGAVVLENSSGNILATTYIQGTGVGPQVAFGTAAQSVAAASLSHPTDLAVDGAGNVYTSEYFGNDVLKETLSNGTYTQSTVATGLSGPFGVTVDGAGNVYIADSGNNRVLKETLSNGSYVQTVVASGLNGPYKVAVDGSGNVYIAEYSGNDVLEETLSNGSYTQSTVASGLNSPWGVAVDGSGNVYVAEYTGNDVLKETLSNGSYTPSTVAGGLGNPQSVAVDGVGNVYIGDSGNNDALMETLSNGSYTQSVIANGLNDPSGIAVDGLGNVYIADSSIGELLKEDVTDAPSLSFATTAVGATSSDSPQTVTLENIGNASLTFPVPASGNNPSIAANFTLNSSGATACSVVKAGSSAATLSSGQSCTLAISFQPTTAGTLTGTLAITDNALNATSPGYATQNIQLSGTSTGSTAQTITFSSISNQTVNLPASISLTATASSGLVVSFASETTSVCTVSGSTATLLTTGTCTIEATQPGNGVYAPASPVTQSFTVQNAGSVGGQTGTNFGSENIGSTSASMPVTVTISNAGTLGNVAALTEGVSGLDFASAGGGTCATGTSYSAGNTCTVNVTFTPKDAGSRYGAVVLADSSANVLGTSYIYGVGNGPQVIFSPATQSVAAANLNHPTDLAVDGAGNVYTVEYYGNDALKETLSNGAYTQSTVATGLNGPFGVAVDGAGDVYIADSGNNRVLKETPSNGSYVQTVVASGLNGPYKVAVDGNGNVFIAEYTGNDILEETLSNGSYTQSRVVSGLNSPWGVAVDGGDNVYIAEYTGNDVLKETLSGGSYTQSTVASGLGSPQSVAVDGVGNVYIGDSGNNDALKETLSNGSYTQSVIATGLNDPSGIAADGVGNAYIADSVNGSLLKEDYADAPSLTFVSTAVGTTSSDSPKTITLENLGNASLTFPVPSSGNNPSISTNFVLGTGSSACPIVASGSSSASLGASQSCTLAISFEPTTTGAVTGTLAITDNALNAPSPGYATQNISLGVLQVATPVASPVAGNYSPLPTVTLSDATPGATICYTIDGSDPTATTPGTCSNGTAYSAGFSLSGPTTVKAIGTEAGYANSLELTSAYEPPVAVSISPTSIALHENQSETFTATVTNTTNTAVTWSISPSVGAITTAGVYTAPSSFTSPETVTVTATSQADTTKSASATVSLYPPVVITWPTPAAINAGTAVSATQLDATASVPGTFAYTPAAGYVPAAGTDALSVTFTPNDTTDYGTTYAWVPLVVNGPAPIINTVAGNGTPDDSENNGIPGPALSAGLRGITAVAFDPSGNLYITSVYNTVVVKVDAATGYLSIVAGILSDGGYSGDGGPATSATLTRPNGIAFDPAGNLYIADSGVNVVRKVNMSTGIITTVAGNGTAGYSGDGGPATSAELNYPQQIVFDHSGNLYISDSFNDVLREVDASTGIISTFAGTGVAGYAGDGGPAKDAELNFPEIGGFDSAGNLYIGDNDHIREISASTGVITTVAGGGPAGFIGDGGPATSANFSYGYSFGLAVDAAGNIYFSDQNNFRVRKITASTGIITTIAGNGVEGFGGDGGPASSAEIDRPSGMTFDANGNLYFGDFSDDRVREVSFNAVVTWPTPSPISYGTALSATQLNATANVPGTFVYSPAAGTVLPAGQNTLSVTFTPTDTTDYQPVTQTVSLTVNPVADSGTVTLTVNGVTAATTTYGAGSTTDTVAAGLASGVTSNSPVSITAVGDELNLESKSTGSTTNYSYALTVTSNDPGEFAEPSFSGEPSGGNLSGGADQNTTGATIYSYSIPSPATDAQGYYGNGSLKGYTDLVMGSWSFSYDNLNRLATGVVTPTMDNDTYFCWSYDAFGNRLQQMGSNDAITGGGSSACQGQSGSATSVEQATYSTANNNQLSATTQASGGVQYDAAGDVTNDGVNTYLYNADGQVCAVESYDATLHMTVMTGYIYDADGQRVAKGAITSMSCDPTVNGFTTQSDYVRDQAGNQLSEFTVVNGSPQWVHTNVYASGELIATDDTNETHFYLNDWLGTRRVMTGPSGVVEQDCMSLPYGDSETCIPLPAENLYTGKEKDEETQGGVSPFGVNQGNDYFGARYYASTAGRWLSPDPSGLAYADPDNPQTLNLYSYVTNNPLVFTDVSGLYCYWDDGSSDDDPWDGGDSKQQCLKAGGNWTDLTNPCQGADDCTTTTTNAPKEPNLEDFDAYWFDWTQGTLSQNIVYLSNSGWTMQLARSGPAQDIKNKYVKGGCKDSNRPLSSGHSAGIEGLASLSSSSPNYVLAEVGGFTETTSTSGSTTTFTIYNTSGQASYSGATAVGNGLASLNPFNTNGVTDNPNGPSGPRHNVNQIFTWTESGLCGSVPQS